MSLEFSHVTIVLSDSAVAEADQRAAFAGLPAGTTYGEVAMVRWLQALGKIHRYRPRGVAQRNEPGLYVKMDGARTSVDVRCTRRLSRMRFAINPEVDVIVMAAHRPDETAGRVVVGLLGWMPKNLFSTATRVREEDGIVFCIEPITSPMWQRMPDLAARLDNAH